MTYTYSAAYDPRTGAFAGVARSDGALIPQDAGNTDWQAFLVWNQTAQPPVSLADGPRRARQPRPLWSIYQDLKALTSAQKSEVWADLSGGTPAKYLLDGGANAAAIGALDWAVTDSGAAGAALTAARLRLAAMYTQDNPGYLVGPAFDPSISVPGDQPA